MIKSGNEYRIYRNIDSHIKKESIMVTKSLSDVIKAALQDPSFHEELLNDPSAVLETKKWELSPEDMKILNEFVSDDFELVVDAKTVFEAFDNIMKGRIPPPPIWLTRKIIEPLK